MTRTQSNQKKQIKTDSRRQSRKICLLGRKILGKGRPVLCKHRCCCRHVISIMGGTPLVSSTIPFPRYNRLRDRFGNHLSPCPQKHHDACRIREDDIWLGQRKASIGPNVLQSLWYALGARKVGHHLMDVCRGIFGAVTLIVVTVLDVFQRKVLACQTLGIIMQIPPCNKARLSRVAQRGGATTLSVLNHVVHPLVQTHKRQTHDGCRSHPVHDRLNCHCSAQKGRDFSFESGSTK